jgi:hypothetical protein
MTDRNIGKLIFELGYVRTHPDKIAEVLALIKFLPVQCDYDLSRDEIIHTGLSNHFVELPLGVKVPTYTISCNNNNGILESVKVDIIN